MKKKKKKRKLLLLFLFIAIFLVIKNQDSKLKIIPTFVEEIYNFPETDDEVLNALYQLTKEDKRIKNIVDRKDEYEENMLYALANNIELVEYVLSYPEKKGKVYKETIEEVKKGEFPLLLQFDEAWGYGMYGENPLALNGCGPTSLAMVIAGLTGKNNITPYKVSQYAYQNGYYTGGTSWTLFTEGAKYFGLIGKELSLSKTKMINELEKNHPIICSMRPGDFTKTGHFIVITGFMDGKFKINDPNSKKRSEQLWSYEQIEHQIKNLWAFELQ